MFSTTRYNRIRVSEIDPYISPERVIDLESETDLELMINSENSTIEQMRCMGIAFMDSSALVGNGSGTLAYTIRSLVDLDTAEVYSTNTAEGPSFEGTIHNYHS